MQKHMLIGGVLIASGAIAYIWVMAAFQVPALQEMVSLFGGSIGAPTAWIVNTAVVIGVIVGVKRMFEQFKVC